MPDSRYSVYTQNNFFVGERKTSDSLDKQTGSSVEELTNYRVLKSGAIKRRLGTRQELEVGTTIDGQTVLKFLEFGSDYIVLLESSSPSVRSLFIIDGNSGTMYPIVPQPYKAVRYSNRRGTTIDIPNITALHTAFVSDSSNSLDLLDIEVLGSSIFVLFERGLPYRIFREMDFIYFAPYFFVTGFGNSYDSFIRSLPIDSLQVEYSDVFFNGEIPINANSSTLTIGNEDLNAGTCRAWLSIEGSTLETPSTTVDTRKMALEEYLFKPIIFNVFPDAPEVISLDVGRTIIRGTGESGSPTINLAYLNDWDDADSYRSTLLSNMDTQCDVSGFSYSPVVNSSAEASIGTSEVLVGSKAQLIRELLYGRRYMIIPYETVGVGSSDNYHSVFSLPRIIADNINKVNINFEELATGELRQNAIDFNILKISNNPVTVTGFGGGSGSLARPVAGIDYTSSSVGLKVDFPSNYTGEVNGITVPFRDRLWADVVVDTTWLPMFNGAYITGSNLAASSVVLVANGTTADDVDTVRVHLPGTLSSSSSSALYRYSTTDLGLSGRSRTYNYVSGGDQSFQESFTETEVLDTPELSRSREITGFNIFGTTRGAGFNFTSGVNGTIFVTSNRECVFGSFNGSRFNIQEEKNFIILNNNNVDVRGAVSTPAGAFVIYEDDDAEEFAYKEFNDQADLDEDDELTLVTLEDRRAEGYSYNAFETDSNLSFRFATSIGNLVAIAYSLSNNRATDIVKFYDAGDEFDDYSSSTNISFEGTLDHLLIVPGTPNILYLIDGSEASAYTINISTAQTTRDSTRDIRVRDVGGIDGFSSSGGRYFSVAGADIDEYILSNTREISGVRTVTKSIVQDFIEGTAGEEELAISLVDESFDVIPFNLTGVTAVGYNRVANNEYLSTLGTSGSFDYPVLDVAGSLITTDTAVTFGSISAVGQHLLHTDDGDFYTWFIHILKGQALSNLDIIYVRVGGETGSIKTLIKQTVNNIQGNVEIYIEAPEVYMLSPALVTAVLQSSMPEIEVSSSDPFVSIPFKEATRTARISSVYANCLIFELGMPSPVTDSGGIRKIGGNNYDLGYSRSQVSYSSPDYNYKSFSPFQDNFTLLTGDVVSFIYQNDNLANNLHRTLTGAPSDEVKALFIQSEYIPTTFGNAFPTVISKYLLSPTSGLSNVVSNSKQTITFDKYINRNGFNSLVTYNKRVVNPRGRSVELTQAVASFDGQGILASSEEGLYSIPVDPRQSASLVHNQRFKFKPLVFHNRFVFISPDDLMVTQFSSRERLGLKSTFSGADQITLLSKVDDIIFDHDTQVYMMIDNEGNIVCATDFDTQVSGFCKWVFEDANCVKLLYTSSGVKGLFRRTNLDNSPYFLVSFDDSITEDFKVLNRDGVPFTSTVVSNSFISNAVSLDSGMFQGFINMVQISSTGCEQINVEFSADFRESLSYDYITSDLDGTKLKYSVPMQIQSFVKGYNPRVTLSQNSLTDCNGVIYGFKLKGKLDGGVM